MNHDISAAGLAVLKKEVKAAISVLDKKQVNPRYTLLNGKALAMALGVDRGFITAMRAHGFTFDRGGRTTVHLAHAWLAQNPQFQGPTTKN